MQLIVIEGPDGTGKSTHADALAAALRESGVNALAWHHKKPASDDPWCTAIDYAKQRASLCSAHAIDGTVYVVDRWWCSTAAESYARAEEWPAELVEAYLSISQAEAAALPVANLLVFLDASDDAIDVRLAKRGTHATPLDYRKRKAYRFLSDGKMVRIVKTDGPKNEVLCMLLSLARSSL